MRKGSGMGLSLLLAIGLAIMPLGAAAADDAAVDAAEQASEAGNAAAAVHASDLAEELGVLLGDGQGVTDAYLAKTSTRVQGAILTLRLLGKEKEALAYGGSDSFSDAGEIGSGIRPVLAYLKQHPELGWNGTGDGKFSPNLPITAQQAYKVMLEALAYKTGTDFEYADTLAFAASKGLFRAAEADPFTNRELATALIETLQAVPKGGEMPLVHELVSQGAVVAEKAALLEGKRIDVRQTAEGTAYLTDGDGMTLYLFTKDMADLNACGEQCLANWPILPGDRLLLADGLNGDDFGSFQRHDGAVQATYKGWPLYYWAKDAQPGDTTGDGVSQAWYTVPQPFYTIALGTDPELDIDYLVDSNGMSLYYFDKDPKDASVCAEDCLAKWPAFHTDRIAVPSGLSAADFGEIIRPDGAKQTTYKGYPLYYWFQDKARGDVTGHGVSDVWFLVNPGAFAGTTAEQTVAEHVEIKMSNYAFSQAEVTVKAGATITFTNRDNDWHNAVAVDGSWKIPLISQGQSVTIQLDEPGIYDYYCEPHKGHMKARIIVQ